MQNDQESLSSLVDEMRKFIRLVDSAACTQHLSVAEKYLTQFDKKWTLSRPNYPNTVVLALMDILDNKKSQLLREEFTE